MKAPLHSRPWRSLLLLAGAACMVALSSCRDQDPSGPSVPGPQFVVWSTGEPCAATGTATADGLLNEPDWYDACTVRFEADLTGSRSTTVTARFMNDGTKAHFSAVSDAPFSNPNSVLRFFLERDGVIHAVGIEGNAAKQWTCRSLNDCDEVVGSVPDGAAALRRNYSGGTAYEIAWPLAELLGGLAADDVVAVRWETVPGGSARPTLYPAAADSPLQLRISGEGVGEYNDPALPDILIRTQHAATVTIRNPNANPFVDPAAFQCKIAQWNGSAYVARFNDLPEGTQWVGTAGNKKTCNHLIWPPLDPEFEPDFAVPGQQGAVFIESAGPPLGGSSAALTWTNWLTAKGNAIPLEVNEGVGELRVWDIAFQGPSRSASCNAMNGNGTTVYAIEPGNHPAIPASPDQPPPGLALTYARKTACNFTGLSFGTTLVLQMRNQDGGESTGLLCPTCNTVTLFQQSNLQGSTLLTDNVGDGSPVDLRTLIYGPVEDGDGVLNGQFSMLATFQGWNDKKGEAQVNFEIVLDRGLATQQTIQVTAFYLAKATRTRAAGWTIDVQPDHQKSRVELGSASFNTTTKEGGVEILIRNWTGVSTAEIRVRSNLAGGNIDNMPNSGFAPWPSGNGGSFASPF